MTGQSHTQPGVEEPPLALSSVLPKQFCFLYLVILRKIWPGERILSLEESANH